MDFIKALSEGVRQIHLGAQSFDKLYNGTLIFYENLQCLLNELELIGKVWIYQH